MLIKNHPTKASLALAQIGLALTGVHSDMRRGWTGSETYTRTKPRGFAGFVEHGHSEPFQCERRIAMIKKMSIFMQPRLFDPEYAHPGLSNALRFVHEFVTSCVMQTKDPEAYSRSWGKMFHYRGPETMWSKVFNPQKHERDILMEAFARAHRIEANLLGDVNGRLIIVVIRFYQRGAKVADGMLEYHFSRSGDGYRSKWA